MAMPAMVSEPTASGAAAGSTPHSKSPVCRSLPSIGGPDLPICARRIMATASSSCRIASVMPRSRITGASTSPPHGAVGLAIGRAAVQANGAGIDRLLPERAEALALERHVAPAHLAAHEELLEAVVDAARQAHALENLFALGLGQRRLDRRPPQEAVAGVDHFRPRLLEPLDGRGARGGLGNALRGGHLVVERLRQRAAERRRGPHPASPRRGS